MLKSPQLKHTKIKYCLNKYKLRFGYNNNINNLKKKSIILNIEVVNEEYEKKTQLTLKIKYIFDSTSDSQASFHFDFND